MKVRGTPRLVVLPYPETTQVIPSIEEQYPYRGTIIKPNPASSGDAKILQQQIAAKFANQDFQPNARLIHFQWMKEYQRPIRLISWRGEIQGVERRPDGVLVDVRVWPEVMALGGGLRVLHSDSFLETYRYANNTLKLVSWRKSPRARPGFVEYN